MAANLGILRIVGEAVIHAPTGTVIAELKCHTREDEGCKCRAVDNAVYRNASCTLPGHCGAIFEHHEITVDNPDMERAYLTSGFDGSLILWSLRVTDGVLKVTSRFLNINPRDDYLKLGTMGPRGNYLFAMSTTGDLCLYDKSGNYIQVGYTNFQEIQMVEHVERNQDGRIFVDAIIDGVRCWVYLRLIDDPRNQSFKWVTAERAPSLSPSPEMT